VRDRKALLPGAANNRLKYISAMCSWAVEHDHMASNVARDVKRKRYATDGFRTWTPSEVAQFEAFWPVGSKPRLALALLHETGARRSDVARIGPANIVNGILTYVPRKTSYRSVEPVVIPVSDSLRDVLNASTIGPQTFLVTEYGRPFSVAGFGNWWRDQCDAAGLHGLGCHGVRKRLATDAAESGATGPEMDSFFGWSSPQQSAVYIRKANKRKLAGTVSEKLQLTRTDPRSETLDSIGSQ
jgi:integrase